MDMQVTAKFAADITDMAAKMNSLKAQLNGVGVEASKTSKTISERMTSAGESMGAVGKKMSLAVTAPLVGIGIAAGKMAMDFDSSMTKIVSLVGISSDEVSGMRKSVLDLSNTTGKSAQELAEALFVVTSAGLRGEAAIKALDASAKASASGLGETADIARSVAGAMNAYGPSVLDAARATDIIVATARAGNFETSQFAAALGGVLPFAKQAGASLADVGGAVALLTRTNGDAAASVTQVTALMRAFVVPTEEAKKALADAGMSASDMRDRISKDGLASALTFLDGKLGGNREQLGKLLGSSEAAAAAFQILDADSQTLASTFGDVADSVGINEEAFAITADTAGNKMQRAFTSLQNALIGLGDIILPLIAGMAEKITALANGFNALPSPVKNVVIVFGALLAAVGPVLIIAGKLMTTWVTATAQISAATLRLQTTFSSAWLSMKTSAQSAVVQIKVAMIAAQTQMGALAAGAKATGLIAVGAFRSIGIAAKGLLLSLGPVGIGLIAVTTLYTVMSGSAAETEAKVNSLTDALREQGDQGEETAAKMFAEDLYNKHSETLDKLGISYGDAVAAIMGGEESLNAFSDALRANSDATKEARAGAVTFTNDARALNDTVGDLNSQYAEMKTRAEGLNSATEDVASSSGDAAGAIDGLGADAQAAASDLGGLQTETQKLSDLFLGFDADIAAIRAKDSFRGFLRDIKDELEGNSRALLNNGKAAEANRETVLSALEKAKGDAVAWGEANGATLAQVEARFQTNATNLKSILIDQGFKKKDIEKFFGADYVNVAGVSVQGSMAITLGTMADRLGPVALAEFKGVGLDLGNGIAVGVAASSPTIDIETRRAINNAEAAARAAAKTGSPSKVFERIGNDLMAGLEKGVKDKEDQVSEKVKAAIEKSISATKESLEAFDSYEDSISKAIVGLLDLGEAYDSYTSRQEAVTSTLAELMKYQASVQGEATDEQKAKLLELQGAYQRAQADAASGAGSIVDEFVDQGKRVQAFNDNLQILLKAGLSRTAFDAIVAEGGERGANIAAALVQGNVQENARRVSEVYTSVQAMGDQTGTMAAQTFMGTGVKLAIEMLEGLIKEFMPSGAKRKALLAAIKGLNDSINFDPKYIDIVTRHFNEGSAPPVVAPGPAAAFDYANPNWFGDAVRAGIDPLAGFSLFGGFPAFADGGIVTGPMLGMVGEAGPEAIIPLSSLPSMLGRGGGQSVTNISVNVNAGIGTDGAEVGREIVEQIKRYERVAGPVFVSA